MRESDQQSRTSKEDKHPTHLTTTETIVKKPEPKTTQDQIPKQYKSNKVSEDANETSIAEDIVDIENMRDAYIEMCNNFSDTYFINTVTCRAHLKYIARLSKFNKRKALSILDSGADTHVFGTGWIPLFVRGPHTQTVDFIGFDNVHARKHGLPIGPHAALVKTATGKRIIL